MPVFRLNIITILLLSICWFFNILITRVCVWYVSLSILVYKTLLWFAFQMPLLYFDFILILFTITLYSLIIVIDKMDDIWMSFRQFLRISYKWNNLPINIFGISIYQKLIVLFYSKTVFADAIKKLVQFFFSPHIFVKFSRVYIRNSLRSMFCFQSF